MAGGHVGEHHQTAVIIGNIVLVSLAAQQAVDNGDDFRPVNGIVGPEGAVAVALYPAVDGGVLDILSSPVLALPVLRGCTIWYPVWIVPLRSCPSRVWILCCIFIDAVNGTGKFEGNPHPDMRIVLPILSQQYNIVIRDGSGINSIADFKGKNIVVGEAGSGQAVTMEKVLSSFNITMDDINGSSLGISEGLDAMRSRRSHRQSPRTAP